MSDMTEGYGHAPAQRAPAEQSAAAATGVTLYRPIIVSILYLCGLFTGFTVLIGLILAYVWRNDGDVTEWEATHFTYLIRTFWIGFWVTILVGAGVIGTLIAVSAASHVGPDDVIMDPPEPAIIAAMFGALLIGFLLFIWSIVRSILSLANAANRRPMPSPKTWLF